MGNNDINNDLGHSQMNHSTIDHLELNEATKMDIENQIEQQITYHHSKPNRTNNESLMQTKSETPPFVEHEGAKIVKSSLNTVHFEGGDKDATASATASASHSVSASHVSDDTLNIVQQHEQVDDKLELIMKKQMNTSLTSFKVTRSKLASIQKQKQDTDRRGEI